MSLFELPYATAYTLLIKILFKLIIISASFFINLFRKCSILIYMGGKNLIRGGVDSLAGMEKPHHIFEWSSVSMPH